MNYIQKEGPGKIINLDNVSSIGITPSKIIFNFSHSITIDNGMMVADYDYWKIKSEDGEDVEDVLNNILLKLGEDAFVSTDEKHYIVNSKNVANILFDEKNKRIIFNLNFSKEIKVHGGYRLSSDFTYWDFDSQDEFENAVEYIKTKVNK